MTKPILVSLIPNLMGESGHVYSYHKSLGEAIGLWGCSHYAAVGHDGKVRDLPANWSDCLGDAANLELEGNLIDKIWRMMITVKLAFRIVCYVRQLPKGEPTILFIERFIHLQLLAVAIALLFISRDNLCLWILYRRDVHHSKTRIIYKILNQFCQVVLSNRVRLLTDSEPLQISLSQYFKQPLTLVPIPHTKIMADQPYPYDNDKVLCWWPGPPRAEKGWEIIKQLVSGINSDKISVLAAQQSNLEGDSVVLIKDELSRSEYDKWLITADVILLPYDSTAYQERTSGIFTETIIAGKIPLVSNNTWMSRELIRYDLTELIIDWDNPDFIVELILDRVNNLGIREKLAQMQARYLSYHNPQSFGSVLQKLCS